MGFGDRWAVAVFSGRWAYGDRDEAAVAAGSAAQSVEREEEEGGPEAEEERGSAVPLPKAAEPKDQMTGGRAAAGFLVPASKQSAVVM